MNDLLGSVKPAREKASTSYSASRGRDRAADYDVEAGFASAPGQKEDTDLFFKKVQEIKQDMLEVKTLEREIERMHEESKAIVRTKEMQALRKTMQDKINEINVLAKKIKVKVEALDKLNEEVSHKKGCGPGSASERTRTSVTAGMKKKLKELMDEFSSLRNKIHDEYREVVERRVYTVTGKHMAEDDIDKMIESGESEHIFQKAIMEQGRGRVLDTLAEIQERHKAVQDLERSLMELHQIFLDMAVLVESQGELLDNIEKQVQRSVEYVNYGTNALQDARKLQRNTRKWMCCALFILLVVGAVIAIVVVRPWRRRSPATPSRLLLL